LNGGDSGGSAMKPHMNAGSGSKNKKRKHKRRADDSESESESSSDSELNLTVSRVEISNATITGASILGQNTGRSASGGTPKGPSGSR